MKETDIERIERALSGVDENASEQLPWLQVSCTLEIALQIAKLRKDHEKPDHVAWLCFGHRSDNNQPYLFLCDSDTPGAFKVYR